MTKNISLEIKRSIRVVKDFPKKNILFQDITSITNNPKLFKKIILEISKYIKKNKISKVAGIEARGFIFAAAVAFSNDIPFVPIRKKNKLPGKTYKQKYKLEYGMDEIHVHTNDINKNDRVLVIDDLIATGGTAVAASKLISKFKPEKISFFIIIDLKNLNGSNIISNNFDFKSLYETNG